MTLSLESVSIQGDFGFISTLLQAQPFLSKSWRCKYICVCCFCLFQVVYIVLVAWQLVLWKFVHLFCFIFTMFTSIDTWHHWCWGLLLLKCILVCLWTLFQCGRHWTVLLANLSLLLVYDLGNLNICIYISTCSIFFVSPGLQMLFSRSTHISKKHIYRLGNKSSTQFKDIFGRCWGIPLPRLKWGRLRSLL